MEENTDTLQYKYIVRGIVMLVVFVGTLYIFGMFGGKNDKRVDTKHETHGEIKSRTSDANKSIETITAEDINVTEKEIVQKSKNNDVEIIHPNFPYLEVMEKSSSQDLPIYPNSQRAIPFENDLFIGKVLIILRTEPEDPFFKLALQGKARYFEIRIQGKFKKKPSGVIYMGGEVPRKMQLGLVTKGAAKALLSIVSKLANANMIHFSFGHHQGNKLLDMPHIICPVWQFAERMLVTKPGETPPNIFEEFVEAKTVRKARMKSPIAPFPMDTEHTYSLSYHSKFLDVIRWQVRGLGSFGKVHLSTFWEDMPLRLVMYDMPNQPVTTGDKGIHQNADKKYYFCFSIQNNLYKCETEDPQLVFFPEDAPKEESVENKIEHPIANEIVEPSEENLNISETNVKSKTFKLPIKIEKLPSLSSNASFENVPILRKNCKMKLDTAKVRVCIPTYVQYYDTELKRTNFAFTLVCRKQDEIWVVLRTNSAFTTSSLPNLIRKKRRSISNTKWSRNKVTPFATLEEQRKQLDDNLMQTGREKCFPKTLVMPHTPADLIFLKHISSVHMGVRSHKTRGRNDASIAAESVVLRCQWETYWTEEWATVHVASEKGPCHISFHSSDSSKVQFTLKIASILSIKCSESLDDTLLAVYPGLELETVGKIYLICFPSAVVRNEWLDVLLKAKNESPIAVEVQDFEVATPSQINDLDKDEQSSGSGSQSDEFDVDSLETTRINVETETLGDYCLIATKRWGNQKRMVLNNRRFVFNGLQSWEGFENESLDPNVIVSRALKLALLLTEKSTSIEFIVFFDQVAKLKLINMQQLKEFDQQNKACFFANLYHTILLHARLMVGQPGSLWGWVSFGVQMSYQVGEDHVFSLTEIEHCIIRNSMAKAKLFGIVPINVPHTKYTTAYGLTISRSELTFVLNHMTASDCGYVPIYYGDTFWEQLSAYLKSIMREHVVVDMKKTTITLPKICQWYKNDLGTTTKEITLSIARFSEESLHEKLMECSRSSNLKVKYAKYQWIKRDFVMEHPTQSILDA